MKYTTNAQLKLPNYADPADIADLNENFTKIDGHLGTAITADGGAHGLRHADGGLEYFNGTSWVSVADDVAYFTYNTATLNEVKESYEAGKAIYVIDGGQIASLITVNEAKSKFEFQRNKGNIIAFYTLNSAGWQKQSLTLLKEAGGTLTGALILNADPAVNMGAATKQYVDTQIAAAIGSVETVLTEADTLLGGD